MQRVVNLHNDLLGCVEWNHGRYHFESRELRCALPQLIESRVHLEVLAIGTLTTPEAVSKAEQQLKLYQKLLKVHSSQVASFQNRDLDSEKVHFLLAVENASSLGNEEDSFEKIVERLEAILKVERLLYISLTWNHENVFGGGNATQVGLKPYGEELLLALHEKQIAIDFSHTSDALAYDILNFIDKNRLKIPLIASHSNLRAICPVARNLPDELAKELFKQKALMGLNFVRFFVGESPKDFIGHIEHALHLGGEDSLALGADFFDQLELPSHMKSGLGPDYFFEEYPNTSCFPKFFKFLEGHFSKELIEKIAFKNAMRSIEEQISKQQMLQNLN